jgi:uncharacterized protein
MSGTAAVVAPGLSRGSAWPRSPGIRLLLPFLLLATLLLASWPTARAEVAVPLVARVTDLTGTLDAGIVSGLEAKLAELEQRKGSQIAVLVVPTTQPEPPEAYALRVVEQWKLGRKGVDDGALLLVATQDRVVRIEVGYGLEGALSDAVSKRIIDEVIVPAFRAGDFGGGISRAVDRMIGVVDGEPLPAPPADDGWHARGRGSSGIEGLLIVGFVAVTALGAVLRRILGRLPAAGLLGAVVAGLGWFLTGVLMLGLGIGVMTFLFVLAGGGGGGGRPGRGGFPGGGWGGGGGGGGFGGGGASGRW